MCTLAAPDEKRPSSDRTMWLARSNQGEASICLEGRCAHIWSNRCARVSASPRQGGICTPKGRLCRNWEDLSSCLITARHALKCVRRPGGFSSMLVPEGLIPPHDVDIQLTSQPPPLPHPPPRARASSFRRNSEKRLEGRQTSDFSCPPLVTYCCCC